MTNRTADSLQNLALVPVSRALPTGLRLSLFYPQPSSSAQPLSSRSQAAESPRPSPPAPSPPPPPSPDESTEASNPSSEPPSPSTPPEPPATAPLPTAIVSTTTDANGNFTLPTPLHLPRQLSRHLPPRHRRQSRRRHQSIPRRGRAPPCLQQPHSVHLRLHL